uniref:Uncharacterized protein n=1 Tax=Anguilla anguilla TaxID=7936 RepID=A0A0E9RR19_ANGAN
MLRMLSFKVYVLHESETPITEI